MLGGTIPNPINDLDLVKVTDLEILLEFLVKFLKVYISWNNECIWSIFWLMIEVLI